MKKLSFILMLFFCSTTFGSDKSDIEIGNVGKEKPKSIIEIIIETERLKQKVKTDFIKNLCSKCHTSK